MARDGIGVGIVGTGVFLPENVRTNDWWSDEWRSAHASRARADLATQVDAMVEHTPADVDIEVALASRQFATDLFRGTRQRRVISDSDESSDMETKAAQAALRDAGLVPGDVDLLMVYSQITDFPTPSNHGLVAHKLGLPRNAAAFTVDAGCASFLPQIATASRLIEAGEYDTALLVVSSAESRVTDYNAPVSVNTGDGAVAAIVKRCDPTFGYVAHVQTTRGELHGGIALTPESDHHGRWYRGDKFPGRLLTTHLDPTATHVMGAHAASLCRETCTAVLDKAGYTIDDVDFFVLSQATAWFGEALCAGLGLPQEKRLTVDEHFAIFGHLLAGSVALNLSRARELGRIHRGDLILIYSPGAGFTQAAMLLRWSLP